MLKTIRTKRKTLNPFQFVLYHFNVIAFTQCYNVLLLQYCERKPSSKKIQEQCFVFFYVISRYTFSVTSLEEMLPANDFLRKLEIKGFCIFGVNFAS